MSEQTTIPFPLPQVSTTPTTWGPPSSSTSTKFHLFPYAPFGRSDRLGRCADFTSSASHQSSNYYSNQNPNRRHNDRRDNANATGLNAEFQYKVQEDDFELVDSSKGQTGSSGNRSMYGSSSAQAKRNKQNRLRQLNARRYDTTSNAGGRGSQQFQKTRGATGGRYGGRGALGGRGGRGGRGWRERIDRQPSVSVKTDWNMVHEMDLNKMTKSVTNNSKPTMEEDLLWCGFVDRYNDVYDKCSTKNPATLKKCEDKEFYPVTTTEDPVIEKLAIEGKGNVFATDAILAHLMTCSRSNYPWDIVVQKLPGSGAIFFDKREFDYLTVNETSNIQPSPIKADDDPDGINTPERLSLEATMCNQNFSQQILKSSSATRKHFELPNPFYDEDDNEDGMEPASVGYRYRRFDLGNDTTIVCRTELHGIVKKGSENQYMTAFALNEYFDSMNPYSKSNVPAAGMINWRDKLDSQRGAVLATELKNNAYKMAKWTTQSILAGADQMKIGFVSRALPRNPNDHQILATQFYRPRDLGVTLNLSSIWGVIRLFVGFFKDQPEGKYVIMKDPNKPIIKIYSVPLDTFEDDEE